MLWNARNFQSAQSGNASNTLRKVQLLKIPPLEPSTDVAVSADDAGRACPKDHENKRLLYSRLRSVIMKIAHIKLNHTVMASKYKQTKKKQLNSVSSKVVCLKLSHNFITLEFGSLVTTFTIPSPLPPTPPHCQCKDIKVVMMQTLLSCILCWKCHIFTLNST